MKIIDPCQTFLSPQEVFSVLEGDLHATMNSEDAEAHPEWLRRKAALHKAVSDYIVGTLIPADRSAEELSLVISALRSYDLTDSQVSAILNYSRLAAENVLYVDLFLQGSLDEHDQQAVLKIARSLRPDVTFNEEEVKALFKAAPEAFEADESNITLIKKSKRT